jgi:hypothetical protein
MAHQAAIQAAQAMTRTEVARLESEVIQDPENVQAREKLFYFYGRYSKSPLSQDDVEARRRHILWLIEHHAEHEILGFGVSQLSPLPSAHFSDPDGYAEAKGLWLARIASDKASTAVLANAACFFDVPDKALAEKLLLRIQGRQADLKWSVRLARVYALALLGAVDAPGPTNDERQPLGIEILATSESESKSEFTKSVQRTLTHSKDVEVLFAVGQYLEISQYLTPHREAIAETARTYFRRAVDIDPHLVPAHQALLRSVLRKNSRTFTRC